MMHCLAEPVEGGPCLPPIRCLADLVVAEPVTNDSFQGLRKQLLQSKHDFSLRMPRLLLFERFGGLFDGIHRVQHWL